MPEEQRPEGEDEFVPLDDMVEYEMDDDDMPPPDSDDDEEFDEDRVNALADEIVTEMEAEDAMMMEGDEMEMEDEEIIDEAEVVLSGHADPVYGVAFHPSKPDMVATAGGDDVGGVWELSTGQRTHTLEGHSDTVNLVAFSADGSLLATGSLDATVKIWSVEGGFTLTSTLEGPGEDINWLAWHPKGNVLLAGSNDCTCWMWSAPTAQSDAVLRWACSSGTVWRLHARWQGSGHRVRGRNCEGVESKDWCGEDDLPGQGGRDLIPRRACDSAACGGRQQEPAHRRGRPQGDPVQHCERQGAASLRGA